MRHPPPPACLPSCLWCVTTDAIGCVGGCSAQRVHRHIDNKDVQTLDALFDYMTPFFASPEIATKYSEVVHMVCQNMFAKDEHREFFIREFEADSDWANVLSASTLLPKKQKICQTSGFCEEDSFVYEREEGDGWGTDECFVCHALMEDLEVGRARDMHGVHKTASDLHAQSHSRVG